MYEHLKEDDIVAVMSLDIKRGKFEPSRTAVVTHVTRDYVYTSSDDKFSRETGHHKHLSYKKISVLPAHLEAAFLLDSQRTDRAERSRELEQKQVEARSRPTYQLACEIVNLVEPEKSVAALERLGEEKLKQILSWLETA